MNYSQYLMEKYFGMDEGGGSRQRKRERNQVARDSYGDDPRSVSSTGNTDFGWGKRWGGLNLAIDREKSRRGQGDELDFRQSALDIYNAKHPELSQPALKNMIRNKRHRDIHGEFVSSRKPTKAELEDDYRRKLDAKADQQDAIKRLKMRHVYEISPELKKAATDKANSQVRSYAQGYMGLPKEMADDAGSYSDFKDAKVARDNAVKHVTKDYGLSKKQAIKTFEPMD